MSPQRAPKVLVSLRPCGETFTRTGHGTPSPPHTARSTPSGWPAAWHAARRRNAASAASSICRSAPPWNTFATNPPPSASTSSANSSAASASAMMRRWSVAACPVVFGAMSDSTRSALPPNISLQLRLHCRVGEIARNSITAPASGSIGSRSTPTTAPRRAAPPPGSSRRRRPQIHHPHPRPDQMEPLIQLDQLERGARPPALLLSPPPHTGR